jgi:hypothetical protein
MVSLIRARSPAYSASLVEVDPGFTTRISCTTRV